MGRKSTIHRLPDPVKKHIERRLRENRLTLDELFSDIRQAFPELESTPSRSALGRYSKSFSEMTEKIKSNQAMAEMLVKELGESFDDKSGALLAQAVTLIATHASMKTLEQDDPAIKDIRALAQAAMYAQKTRVLSVEERQSIEKAAREKLIRQQRQKLDELEKNGTVPKAVLAEVIRAAYGLEA